MENILYIGPYREFSGMGNAARQYIRALINTGNNICIRPIYNMFQPYPEEEIGHDILELEANFSKRYHKVIQHCYPHQLCYDSKFDQNIGIIHLESSLYNGSLSNYINIMDNIIVGSNFVKNTLLEKNHSISNKIHVIPEPIDLEVVKNYKNNNKSKKDTNLYSFYVLADFIKRKNIEDILLAFLILSDKYENIELVIKTKSHSSASPLLEQTVEYEFEKIYNVARKNYSKKPQVLIGDIKYDGIKYIHHNNDCIINISSGESFGYSVLEAMAFNNNTIVTNNTALSELTDGTGHVVESDVIMCVDNDRLFSIYNTIDQQWRKPIFLSLISKMSKAILESQSVSKERISKQNDLIQNYTVEAVSKRMLEL